MSRDEETASLARIEASRRVVRKAADMCVARGGASIEDVAIGVVYAAFDVAERHAGPELGAIEWLRTAVDMLESGLLKGTAPRSPPDAS